MRLLAAVICLSFLVVAIASNSAFCVGFERQDASSSSPAGSKEVKQNGQGLSSALKEASFFDKYPAVLDEIASTVREVLSQLGLKPQNSN
jgi:hypothetical protein